MIIIRTYAVSLLILLWSANAFADSAIHTTNQMGLVGINTIPSARMDRQGNARAGISFGDPLSHAFIGFQLADPLYISLRQSGDISSLQQDPSRLYPGMDFKLRLLKESTFRPDLSVGAQSALGHAQTGGEFLVASKRYRDFDLSLGAGWGRLGSAGHVKNPLGFLSSHFDKDRELSGENPLSPNDWFTGNNIGFFGGVEYFTPLDGLSIKADWNADRNYAEKTLNGFRHDSPWSVALSYSPDNWMTVAAGINGTDTLMARLSFQNTFDSWPGRGSKSDSPPLLIPQRRDDILADNAAVDADTAGLMVMEPELKQNGASMHSHLYLSDYMPPAQQIGRAARHMANNAQKSVEGLTISAHHLGLRGPVITFMRRDLEAALIHHQGSPEEVWQNTTFSKDYDDTPSDYPRYKNWNTHIILDNAISLSEEDTGIIHRTGLLVDSKTFFSNHFMAGGQARINTSDSLHKIDKIRPASILPVRSDVSNFAERTFALERGYMGWFKSFNTDWHIGGTGGYLEEMYQGLGGEILYRPFGKTYAFGAEAWQVFKRDPDTTFNLGLTGDHLLTGHITGYYEIPDSDMTASLQLGRYLAEDFGGTLGLQKNFDNGVKMRAFATMTDTADYDIFGSNTHLYSGLRFDFPIGNIPVIGAGSSIRVKAEPQGRDTGQRLEQPLPLYEMTEPLSYRAITRSWNQILD